MLDKLGEVKHNFNVSPLNIAIENDLFSWEGGMKLLFESNPGNSDDLDKIDPKTNLFPFMIAGMKCDSLDVTYKLLCSKPSILQNIYSKKRNCDMNND